MEHLNCRGEETRRRIVNEYDIKLVIYAKLLNGKTKHSDANETLTDRYYEFKCTLKSDNRVLKAITCGSGAGEHLLKLANIKKPPIFNPFINENNGNAGGQGGNGNNGNNTWKPLAKELYNAIQWLICCWNTIPYGKLLDVKKGLEDCPYNDPSWEKVTYINNVIGKDNKGRTLTEMINEVRNAGNDIREYSFPLINSKLQENNIESHF